MKIISYLEFKLNKEMAYENTFGKEEKIQKEYEEYVKEEKEKISGYYLADGVITYQYEEDR